MEEKAWIVAVDMGYGHQRAAYPLRRWSPTGKVVLANNYAGMSAKDRVVWKNGQRVYDFFSRLNNVPVIGHSLFHIMDKFQEVLPFYPRRDLVAPNLQVRQTYYAIRAGFGSELVNYLNTQAIPLITTFFTVAFMAEEHGFKQDIYLVICDADISRAWAPFNPHTSRIKYLAPCRRVVERLKLYGVNEKNIFLTGFPLPDENSGGKDLSILKKDLAERIVNLDPQKHYREKYSSTVKQFLSDAHLTARHTHPLTITFAIGGAGAQRQLGGQILQSLRERLFNGSINLNMVAGTRHDVYHYFTDYIHHLKLGKALGRNLKIIFSVDKEDYFRIFNAALRSTDVLWSKPSEMVFYSALGLPIIMAPTLGSQELFNRQWLRTIGAGIQQEDPRYAHEWLFDWVDSGWLAQAAMSGYLDGRQFGVHNIADVVFKGIKEPAKNYQLL